MFPPVTTRFHRLHITPQRMCIAVWVRIIWRRRSSATSPVTTVSAPGIGPARVCQRVPSTVTTSMIDAAPASQIR